MANSGFRRHSTEYFLCLAKSLEYAGIVKTEIAQLSVVLSLLAYFFFQEQFNSLKLLGIGLGIFAVLLILLGHFNESSGSQSKSNFCFDECLVWICCRYLVKMYE